MDRNSKRAKELLLKYQEGKCTPEEMRLLENWYLRYNEDQEALADKMLEEDFMELELRLSTISKKRAIRLYIPAIAAAVVLIIAGTFLFFELNKDNRKINGAEEIAYDILPGTNKATLTLANGRKISLNDSSNGVLANEGNSKIIKTCEGQLVYESVKADINPPSNFINIVETPAGGEYQLLLPDGSKAWLNAKSSLKYPTSFRGNNQRIVELTGEGYFEIAHNSSQPFIVKSAGQEIKVLGTHFNVNAYADEPYMLTTLLQGSVQVSRANKITILRPGEQSQIATAGIMVRNVNTERVVAWKNGKLAFKKTSIRQVLREISRWYDIEIEYMGNPPDYTISGEVSRQSNLSGILKILSLSDVHYKQQGRKLSIFP